jgi:DNA-binding NarL/FixJ family response regulator
MDDHLKENRVPTLGTMRSREWMHQVISLLEAAVGQLQDPEHPAQGAMLEAASLMRRQVHPAVAGELPYGKERLLAWQGTRTLRHRVQHVTDSLSPREYIVLRAMSCGLSNKRIAQELQIAPETVKSHVKGIFIKLAVQTRAHAVSTAGALGLL